MKRMGGRWGQRVAEKWKLAGHWGKENGREREVENVHG